MLQRLTIKNTSRTEQSTLRRLAVQRKAGHWDLTMSSAFRQPLGRNFVFMWKLDLIYRNILLSMFWEKSFINLVMLYGKHK